MLKPIVVVGSINIDLVATSDRLPVPGETVFGNVFNTFFGGKGANQAVAAAKLGYPVTMIGKVGEDAFGSQLIDGLRQSGVDVNSIQKVRSSSGVALIITDQHGENCIVVVPGANGELKPSDLDKYRQVLLGAGIILTQLEIPLETVSHLVDLAKKMDVPLMLDPAPAQRLPASLLQQLTWITPNETEASQILASKSHTNSEEQVADELLNTGVRHAILKLGSRGALVAQNHVSKTLVPGFAVKAVDTTAAGDAFNGGFAVAILRGLKPIDAAHFANAVAAISITRAGAQSSMPTGEEVEQFLRQPSSTAMELTSKS
jgi:ribokinase